MTRGPSWSWAPKIRSKWASSMPDGDHAEHLAVVIENGCAHHDDRHASDSRCDGQTHHWFARGESALEVFSIRHTDRLRYGQLRLAQRGGDHGSLGIKKKKTVVKDVEVVQQAGEVGAQPLALFFLKGSNPCGSQDLHQIGVAAEKAHAFNVAKERFLGEGRQIGRGALKATFALTPQNPFHLRRDQGHGQKQRQHGDREDAEGEFGVEAEPFHRWLRDRL